MEIYDSSLSYRLTVGYLFDSVNFSDNSTNGEASFDTMPLNLSINKSAGSHTFGGGIVYHLGPEYEICSFNCGKLSFEDAFGPYLQYRYGFGSAGYVAARYSVIEYEAPGLAPLEGNSLGIYLGAGFD